MKSIDLQFPPLDELLSQTWDKEYYYEQWSENMDLIDCAYRIDVSECQVIVNEYGGEPLKALMIQFLAMLEFGINALITIQEAADEKLDMLADSIAHGPGDVSCITSSRVGIQKEIVHQAIEKLRRKINLSKSLIPEFTDYTERINAKSQEIMNLFKSQIQQTVERISYVIHTQLRNQINYVLINEKIDFMETVNEKFSQKLTDIDENIEEQAAMMSLAYQLYNHLQIDSFELFLKLNNRFEYENLWRFNMKVCID